MKNTLKMWAMGGVALAAVGLVLAGCKSAPDFTSADAQKLLQAKYDADPPVPVTIRVDDTAMRQGVTAKYWDRSKAYPIRWWADFKLSEEGKKAIKLEKGGDTIEWRPESADDKNFAVEVQSVATGHLRARDVKDPQNESDGTKSVEFNEAVNLDGLPAPLADMAHNPGNKLSDHRTATFSVANGAWKLDSIQ